MSKVVDERIVSLQFDNKRFESNVATTMSTLDKLKQKLNLSGSAKGLENISTAANKVDMSGLSKGVETVQAKFSALQVVGVTALSNLANSAVNAAKRFISALTIDPIKDGFNEYELMLNSIQTTMAGTGKTAKEVEEELKKLDEYADKTVYSTADMLNNLPKFTNAGVALEDTTTAMIGIANATALAGGDASKASIAFYNLGQAIGTGYLTRMDYNSINNAGIATMEWKQQMVDAAIAAGTLKKAGEDAYVAGGKTFTLQQLFIDGLQHQWATTDVMMKVFKDYGDEQTEIGKKAYAAAQDIKTYTQMMESLKATAGTGWKDTWQLIFGDLDGAKVFWTSLTNTISGVITKIADIRNKILDVAMSSPLAKMADKIEDMTTTVKKATKPLKEYADIVDRIIRGDFGNQGDEGDKNYRKKRVEASGYDYETAQTLVNEKLGINVKLTSDLTEAQKEQNKEQSKTIDQLAEMSKKQLKSLGYTDDQIDAIKTLSKYAKDAGVPLSEFINNIDQMSGREMLIQSFKNAGEGLVTIFQSMKDAFLNIFPVSAESIGLRIYSVLTKIYNFSQKFKIGENEKTVKNLTRTFEGLFAALDIVLTIVKGPLGIAFKLLSQLLSVFDLDVLTITAKIADVIIKFHDWLEKLLDFTAVFEWMKPYIESATTAIKNWIDAVKPMEKIAAVFKRVADAIKDFAKSIWEADFTQNIVDGLVEGLTGGAKRVWNAIVELAKGLIAKFKAVLGINSPSKVFMTLGGFIIAGLIAGLTGGLDNIGDIMSNLGSKLVDVFGDLDWSAISSLFMNLGKLFPSLKILNFISGLGGLFSIGGKDVMAGLANGLTNGASVVWNAIVSIATTLIDKFKEVLDINSPSKVFFLIGGFIIAGLVGGLIGGTGNIKEALANIGNTIVEFFKNLDIGAVVAAGIGIGSIVLLTKIFRIFDKFGDAAKGIGKFAGGLGDLAEVVSEDGIKGLLTGKTVKPSKLENIISVISKLAISIAILAGSLILLSKMEGEELQNGAKAMLLLTGIMAGLVLLVKMVPNKADINGMGTTLIQIAGTMAIMAIVIKLLGSMYSDDIWQAVAAIGVFTGIIIALMAATKLISGSKNVDKIGRTLIKISGAILIMALVAKIAGSLETSQLIKGTAAILAFSLILSGLMLVTKVLNGSKNIDKIGGTLLKISGAMLIMLAVAKLASMMSPADLNKGFAVIMAFSGIVVGLMAATKLIAGGNKKVDAIGGAIFKIAGAMALMLIVAKVAASMSPSELAKGITIIAIFSGIVVGLMAATKLIGSDKNVGKIGKAILGVGVAIAAMTVAAKIASTMSASELTKGILAVTAFSAIIVGLMAATKVIGGPEKAENLGKTILMIGASIGIMAVSVALLSLIDPKRLTGATVIMSVLMGMFALVAKAASNIQSSIGSLVIITVAIGMLGLIIWGLSKLPIESCLGSAGALSMLLLSMAGSLALLGTMKSVPWAAIGAIALMGLVVAEIALIVGALSYFNVDTSVSAISGVTVLLLAMTGVLAVLALLGPMTSSAFVGIGALAVLGLVVAELAAILGVMSYFDVNPSIEVAGALSLLLISMSASLVILGTVGLLGPAAFIGIGALATLIAGVGTLLVGIGALVNKFPQLETFLDVGIPILDKIGHALGSFFGNIVSGFADGVLEIIPNIGTKLSEFMTNATPFIDGAKNIDPAVMEGVKTLAEAMLILTGANLLEGIGRFLGFGDSSLASFGSQLGGLGANLNTFVTNLGTFSEEQVTTVSCAGKAIKALADAAGEIPAEGGWLAALFGDNSLSTFGSKLPELAIHLKGFITNLGTFSEDQVTTVDCAGKAIKALAEAASGIPDTGGLWAAIVGDNSLATFGSSLPGLGTNLNSFVTNLGTFSEEQVTTVNCAGKAIKALADAAGKIPNDGGLWGAIVGDNSLSSFSNKLPGLGTDLASFVSNLGTFSAAQVATVDSAVKAINALANLASDGIDASKISDLGGKLKSFAKKIKTFSDEMGKVSIDQINTSTGKLKTLVSTISSITSADTASAKSFGETLQTLAKSGVDKFVKAFTGESTKAAVKKAADTMVKALINGLDKKLTDIRKAGEKAGKKGADGMGSSKNTSAAKSSGKDLGKGLVRGIEAKYTAAYNAGYRLGQKAVQGEKDGQQSKSPSKLTIQAGKWLGEGLIIGMDKMGGKVYKSGKELGQTATGSLSTIMSRVADTLSSDLDTAPTIRPVLDLSDIEAGASSLNGMFGTRATIGVSANANAVSAMMRTRQNGSFGDVVDAIDKLDKHLNNVGNTTYSINGVTYDDGSNITDAVRTIVRAARVERRV